MDISGCGSSTVSGWDNYCATDVQELAEVDKTEDKVATVR